MPPIPISQAAVQLDALVQAALAGDEVVLERDGKSVRLVPLTPDKPEDAKPADFAFEFRDFIGKAEGLPTDMARNHDHYVHGAPKK